MAANRGEDNRALLARVEELRTKLLAVQSIVEETISFDSASDYLPNTNGHSTSILPKPSVQYVPPKPPAVIVVEDGQLAMPTSVVETEDFPSKVDLTANETEAVEGPAIIELVESNNETPSVATVTINESTAPAYESIADPMVKAALLHMDEVHAAFLPPVEEVHELPLTEEMIEEAEAIEMAKLQPLPASFEQMPTPKEVAEQDEENAAKELNDKLAQRTKVLNELFVQKVPVLAEKIVPGKIGDLRKAISINEKYQFIQSLFRGDEQMFERSVKTLNEFAVFQEAQFWMQRELLLKLGWDENDALVQHFVSLVQRRFA